jgi:tetratricopeptide (TPR) repeat protein
MRLVKLAPAAGHLVHMPSHIYYRTGDHEMGAAINLQAAEADRAYMAKTGTTSGIYPLMYYSHNIHFESIAHAMAGRYADSMRAARQLEQHVAPHVKDMAMLETNFLAMPIWTLVRFGKWEDVLKYQQPDPNHHWMTAMWHFSRGMAFAKTGKPADAEKEMKSMAALQAKIPNEVMMQNKAHDIFAIAHHMLAGTIAESKRDFASAIEHYQQAVATQRGLVYIEPPEWPFPMMEVLGHGYLAAARYEDAEKAFRADLDYNPRNGRSLFGLAEALRGQGRGEEAKLVEREFKTAWAAADTQLQRGDAHAARAND